MKLLISTILMLLSGWAQAEFATIQDPDGYTNIRKSPSSSSAIIGKLKSGSLFFCDDAIDIENNFCKIQIKKQYVGYIHTSRIKYISLFPKIPLKAQKKNKLIFSDSNAEITVIIKSFDKSQHQLTYTIDRDIYPKDQQKVLSKIDGLIFYGRDQDIPTTEYSSIEGKIDGNFFSVPKIDFKQAYEVDEDTTKAYLDAENRNIYVMSKNGQDCCLYQVIFTIHNEKYIGKNIAAYAY